MPLAPIARNRFAALALSLFALLALFACSMLDAQLAPVAADYYNYMQGLSPGRKYSSFLSPAYLKSLPKESVKLLDDTLSRNAKKNERAIALQAQDVILVTTANFGLSAASETSSHASRELGHTQWVKVRNKWYVFMSSDAEVSAYGQFPPSLQLPASRQRSRQDPDAPQ